MFKRTRPASRSKLVNTAAVTLALAGGGVVGAVVGAPLISSAQEDDPTTTTEDTIADEPETDDTVTDDTGADDTVTDDTEPGESPSHDSSGTETNDSDDCEGGPRFGGHGIISETVTELLGIDEDALREALADGQTLAEVAEEQGVSRDELVGALVAEAETRIDERVTDGDIEADEATELKENIAERIDELVDGEIGDRGDRPGGPWFGRGMPRPGERFDRFDRFDD
jgi:hypothetical protein